MNGKMHDAGTHGVGAPKYNRPHLVLLNVTVPRRVALNKTALSPSTRSSVVI